MIVWGCIKFQCNISPICPDVPRWTDGQTYWHTDGQSDPAPTLWWGYKKVKIIHSLKYYKMHMPIRFIKCIYSTPMLPSSSQGKIFTVKKWQMPKFSNNLFYYFSFVHHHPPCQVLQFYEHKFLQYSLKALTVVFRFVLNAWARKMFATTWKTVVCGKDKIVWRDKIVYGFWTQRKLEQIECIEK